MEIKVGDYVTCNRRGQYNLTNNKSVCLVVKKCKYDEMIVMLIEDNREGLDEYKSVGTMYLVKTNYFTKIDYKEKINVDKIEKMALKLYKRDFKFGKSEDYRVMKEYGMKKRISMKKNTHDSVHWTYIGDNETLKVLEFVGAYDLTEINLYEIKISDMDKYSIPSQLNSGHDTICFFHKEVKMTKLLEKNV